MSHKLGGVVTALVTPFKKGKVDEASIKKLVRTQIDGGVSGFVVNGTTGESPTLDWREVQQIFKLIKKESDGAVKLIVGTGSNSTATTIEKTKAITKWGADAALVVVPYYNKPPQRGLVAHFQAVAKASKVPVILYNVPGRTVISMAPETVAELSKTKRVVGIKEASGSLDALAKIKASVPANFLLSSGDDATCIDFMSAGGHGVISVISHLIPSELSRLAKAAVAGDRGAVSAYEKYKELNTLMGIEANPMPVKMGLYLQGIIKSPELRLPLVTLASEHTKRLEAAMKELGIL
jgi:4-hydroxy-tetrahydrodipicolinate synthase